MKIILLLATLFGVATVYPAEVYGGNVLYCDTAETEYYYTDDLAFVALPLGGDWQCGDFVIITFDDSTRIKARVLDSGLFIDNCVIQDDDECLSVIVDVPSHLWFQSGISAKARLFNVSKANRLMEDAKIGYTR